MSQVLCCVESRYNLREGTGPSSVLWDIYCNLLPHTSAVLTYDGLDRRQHLLFAFLLVH